MNKLIISSLCLSTLISIHAMDDECKTNLDLWNVFNEIKAIVQSTSPKKGELLQILCQHKEKIEQLESLQDKHGNTLLHYAVHSGNLDAIRHLLYSGKQLEISNNAGHNVSAYTTDPELRQCLIDETIVWGLGQNIRNKKNDAVKEILEKHPNVINKQPKFINYPPLLIAAQGNLGACQLLVAAKADVNIKEDIENKTPLHEAGSAEIVQFLMEQGAFPNTKTKYSLETPLHRAAVFGKTEVVKCLLKNGADPKIKNNFGELPIERTSDHLSFIKNDRINNHPQEEFVQLERIIKVFEKHAVKNFYNF